MLLFQQPTTFSYVALGIVTILALPTFLRRMLAVLREWDDYRTNRSCRPGRPTTDPAYPESPKAPPSSAPRRR